MKYPEEPRLLKFQLASAVSSWESKRECERDLGNRIRENHPKSAITQDSDRIYVDVPNGGVLQLQCLPDNVEQIKDGGLWREYPK